MASTSDKSGLPSSRGSYTAAGRATRSEVWSTSCYGWGPVWVGCSPDWTSEFSPTDGSGWPTLAQAFHTSYDFLTGFACLGVCTIKLF